jgi:hypothetical protein
VKILVNVAWERFRPGEWVDCEAIRFEEDKDGSFSLLLTTDVERMRKSDADLAALAERMKGSA